MHAATTASNASAGTVGTVFIVTALLIVWLLPVIIGALRHVQNLGSIAVIDLLLGWTLIGWVVALAMACRTVYRRPRHKHQPPSWQPRWDAEPSEPTPVPGGEPYGRHARFDRPPWDQPDGS